jgi:hypothetical protein
MTEGGPGKRTAPRRLLQEGSYPRRIDAEGRVATFLTLVLSSGATTGFLGRIPIPTWAPGLLAMLAAGVSLYSLVAQNLKAAFECSDLLPLEQAGH